MKQELVCVDHRVADLQALISDVCADSRWVLIESCDTGLKQIGAALTRHRDVASLRILAHGRPGALWLGSGELNADTLSAEHEDAQSIGEALGPGGDVQVYACEVGLDRHGRSFVDALTSVLGVPVSASSTPMGSAELGGDWRLDVGEVRCRPLDRPQWFGLLGLTIKDLPQATPGRTSGEWRNSSAFAALRADGAVVSWGDPRTGGDSSAVAAAIDGTIDVTQVFSSWSAFAALRADGSVVTWGSLGSGGDSSAVASAIDGTLDVTQIFSSWSAFAALRADGSVVTWGNARGGGNSSAVALALDGTSDIRQVCSTGNAFAALRADGAVVSWGDQSMGGDSSGVASAIDGTITVTQLFSTHSAFAALRADGSVVTWGYPWLGGDSSAVASAIDGTIDVSHVFSAGSAFAALRADGSVVTWGDASMAGNSSAVAAALDGTIDVIQVVSNYDAFAALRTDGSVVTWGDGASGGVVSLEVASALDGTIDVTQIYSTWSGFAALRADGSVVTWGEAGGNSGAVASALDGTIDVTRVYSTGTAFAALRTDGSVVTWGYAGAGGDSGAVAPALDGTIDVIGVFSNDGAFAALRVDGSVVTWGSPTSGGTLLTPVALGDAVSIANPLTDDSWRTDDAESTLVVRVLNGRQFEGDSGDAVFDFEIERFGAISQFVGVEFKVAGSGAAAADSDDFGGVLPHGIIAFAPGETRKVISVHVAADTTTESDESFRLSLETSGGAVIAVPDAYATIRNDDTNLEIAAVNPDQSEGDGGTTSYSFTLSRTGFIGRVSTVDYRVTGQGSTPADAADFGGSLPAGTVTFLPGEASKQITVDVTGDTRVEADEGFAVELSYPRGGTLGVASAEAVIRSDDTQPTVWISADRGQVSESESSTSPFLFTVHRIGDLSLAASVDYAVVATGADSIDAADFGGSLPSGTLSFAPGETTKAIQLTVVNDSDFEGDEAFAVTLTNPMNLVIDTATAVASILDDDQPLFCWIRPKDATKSEGNVGVTAFSFDVIRFGELDRAATVTYQVHGAGLHPADSADFGGTLPSGSLTFDIGESARTLVIEVRGDREIEFDETFDVTIRPSNSTLDALATTATGEIIRDDGPPVFSILAASDGQYEGDSETPFSVIVQRHGDLSVEDTIQFVVSAAAVDAADAIDFGGAFPTGSILFAPNEMEKALPISVWGDTDIEGTEGFILSIQDPSRGTIETGSKTFSILNDDELPLVRIDPLATAFVEGNSGSAEVKFVVLRYGDLSQTTSVEYVVRGTGLQPANGDDFGGSLPAGRIVFAPGEHSKSVAIEVTGDATPESSETFSVFLQNVTFGRVAGSPPEIAIVDDDGFVPAVGASLPAALPAGRGPSMSSSPILQHASLSSDQIMIMADMAHAAYKPDIYGALDGLAYLGWRPVNATELGLHSFPDFDGIFYKGDPNIVGDRGRALVLINDIAKTVAVSFRGTDQIPADFIDYINLLGFSSRPYISAFDGLLKGVGRLFDTPGFSDYDLWVTGHSLGAGIANELREISDTGGYHSAFHRAKYVTFATPIVADRNESRILNIGFENDWVFKAGEVLYPLFNLAGFRPDYDSTTDNLILSVAKYPSLSYYNPFGVLGIHTKMPETYRVGVDRILSSEFYSEITRDDVIIIDEKNSVVYDAPSISALWHQGRRVFLLGQDKEDDILFGSPYSVSDDSIEGRGGNDTLSGYSGNDILIGGDGRDTFRISESTNGHVTFPQGHDVVRDFEAGIDSIDYGSAVIQLKEVLDVNGDGDLDTFIYFSPDSTLTLLNVGTVVSLGGPISVEEGKTAVFEVLRTGTITTDLTVHYEITGAVTRKDSVTFAVGSARETIPVASLDNAVDEPDRHYTVTILDPGQDTVVLGNATAAGTIRDNDPTPWTSRDPHMLTLDGLAYDFQAVGEFVLVENTAGAPLLVQMRTQAVGDLASSISALAVAVDGHRVTVNTNLPDVLRVDGVVTNLADGESLAVGGGRIERIGQTYTVTTAAGDIISAEDFGAHLDLALTLASGRAPGSVRGLLGNFNQDTSDDLALTDGTVLAQPVVFADLYGSFAEGWRVSAVTSLFDYASGESTETFTDRSIPRYEVTLDMLPGTVVAEATRLVDAAGITDPVLRAAAMLDYALTSDLDYIIGATKVDDPLAALSVVGQPAVAQSVLSAVGRVDRQVEGSSGQTELLFDIHRSGNTAGDLAVTYRVAGTTPNPVDANDLGGSLPTAVVTFGDGETLKTIAVRITGDTLVEPDENLLFEISVDPSVRDQVAFATTSASATVANDDGTVAPRFAIEAVAAIQEEGGAGQTTELLFRVTRTENTQGAATVDYAIAGLGFDPVEEDDFVIGSLPAGTLVFGPGEAEQMLRIGVAGDELVERNERFQVTLANPSAGVIDGTIAIGMITNDDVFVSRHSLGAVDRSLTEGNDGLTEYRFSILRSGNVDGTTTVDFAVSPSGSAPVDAADFGGTLPTGTVVFGAGEVEKSVSIALTGDSSYEADERFTIALSNPSAGAVVGSSATWTILNDDAPPPSLSIWRIGANPSEGNVGANGLRFAVVRTGDLSARSTVDYAVTPGNAPAADDQDLVGGFSNGAVTFESQEDFKIVTIDVAGDSAVEADESIRVVLSNPGRAVIDIGAADALIVNDDSVVSVTIAGSESEKPEGSGSDTSFLFTVSRIGDLSKLATVSYSVVGSVNAADFFGHVLPAGVVELAAGETEKTLEIRVVGDSVVEPDESFAVELSNAVGTIIGTATASATIVNDDLPPPPELSIAAGTTAKPEGDGGSTLFSFTVTRSGDTSGITTVDYSVAGTGTKPADAADFGGTLPSGTLTFAPGEIEQVVTIAVTGDTTVEADEQVAVTLSNPGNATLAVASASTTIENDDVLLLPTVSIAAEQARLAEGNSGTTAFSFLLTRTGDLSGETTVSYSLSGAADASDFVGGLLPNGLVVFAPGSSEQRLTIEVAGDGLIEPNEAFTIMLHDPVNATVDTASAATTIVNDDTSSFKIGDAPARPPRSDAGAWERSWTHAGVTIAHKANLADANESYSNLLFASSGSGILAGGDVSGGDLGVSGQTLATSAVLQELDGSEGLRFLLDEEANQISFQLSRFSRNDDGTGFNEAGRLQLLDTGGQLVREIFFAADAVDGSRQVAVAVEEGFTQAIFAAGAHNGNDFVYGAYANQAGDGFGSNPFAAGGAMHGSEYLIDSVAFTSGYVDLLWTG